MSPPDRARLATRVEIVGGICEHPHAEALEGCHRGKASVMGVWADYDKWDEAFREAVYGGVFAHQPVFLDVEDALLVDVAKRLGLDLTAAQAEVALASAVRKTLALGAAATGMGVLAGHRDRLDRWQRRRRWATDNRSAAPPVIALLAVFARAAELMGRDDQYTSAAYFPRLYQLLHVPPADEARVAAAYRHNAERLWGALNSWLDSMAGTRGLPTAEAIGHRYVGIALSQALIREADRHLLVDFFVTQDLEPGLRLGADDMTAYLEPWVKAGHGSASMKKLFRTSAGRSVLAEAAALALAKWDGESPGQGQVQRVARPPVLTARVTRDRLGGSRLRLGFALRGSVLGHQAIPARWQVLSAPKHPRPEVSLETLTDGLVAPDLVQEVDGVSLLTGQLKLAPADPAQEGRTVVRRPQPVVLLRYVEEAGLYAEVDRARLSEPHMLLVNAAATKPDGTPRFDLDTLLTEIAQPGYTKVPAARGIPEGWALYRDVVIVHRHDRTEFALDPLKPAQTSALKVTGGFRMPGHAARWHADVPLDVSGTASEAVALQLRLLRLDGDAGESEILSRCAEHAEIALSTDGLGLAAGQYRAEMVGSGATKRNDTRSVATFMICTSANPRIRPRTAPLGYRQDSALGALAAAQLVEPAAGPGTSAPVAVRGAVTPKEGAPLRSDLHCSPVWWSTDRAPIQRAVLTEPAAPNSCAITGQHREHIETHHKGMKYNRAVCLGCGRVKLYKPVAPRKKPAPSGLLDSRQPLAHLSAVRDQRPIRGATLLDALIWLGDGDAHEVAHLVRQVDDSALTVDEALRALECLGHIDVARDPEALAVQEWAVAPRALAGLEDGSWFLAGSWDRTTMGRLQPVVDDAGATLVDDDEDWLPRRRIIGLDLAQAQWVGSELRATVVPNAGRTLMSTLRPLSQVASALPRVSVEGVFDAEWFNPAVAAWTAVETIGEPGAYRLRKGFVSTYLYRTKDDVGQGTAIRATSQTVKHLASSAQPLVGYDADDRVLFVPLGADLPGLYGRALSLLSGRSASRIIDRPLLAYQSVPPAVASTVVELLGE